MAAAPGHVFHVEFGINDTELTRALEQGNYSQAQKLIRDNAHTSYLDEGCYQRIPLYIVLSGVTQEGVSSMPRNFHVAKLLVQHGASINHRVPETEFGAEYLSPGKTGVELVVDLFTQLTLHPCHATLASAQKVQQFSLSMDIVIGLGGKMINCSQTLLDECLELIFIMLSHGGDSNVRDEYNMTLLHRAAVLSTDDRLLTMLCEAGADLNALDGHKNTPLAALCDPFPFGTQLYSEEHDIIYTVDDKDMKDGWNPLKDCCNLQGKEHFLDKLLLYKDVKLDVQNRQGRTALFHCVVRGDLRSATLLLQHGCDATLRGRVLQRAIPGIRPTYRSVSPLFAALCSNRVVKYHHEAASSILPSYQFLAHLVDAGYFSQEATVFELNEHLQQEEALSDIRHLQDLGSKVIHLMFGSTTSTLRQLSARKVISAHALQEARDIHELLERLRLPKDKPMILCFEVELLRQKLCQQLKELRWFRLQDLNMYELNGTCTQEMEGYTDSDSMSGGDSDLEYW